MDLDCDTIFVKVYDFDRISRISLVPPVLRWFSRTKKEEVIWPVPARLCLDYLREWEWRASESTLFLHMLLSSSADMPDCQLDCKSMKWAQVLTMTEKEQKVQLTAGNRRFPEKINSMSIKTLSPGPLPKWPKWPMLWYERRPKLNLKVDSTQAVPGISWVWVGRGTPAKFKPSFQAARLRTSDVNFQISYLETSFQIGAVVGENVYREREQHVNLKVFVVWKRRERGDKSWDAPERVAQGHHQWRVPNGFNTETRVILKPRQKTIPQGPKNQRAVPRNHQPVEWQNVPRPQDVWHQECGELRESSFCGERKSTDCPRDTCLYSTPAKDQKWQWQSSIRDSIKTNSKSWKPKS